LTGLLAESTVQDVPSTEARTFYYISDHLGTSQLIVDSKGEVVWQGNYAPFGQVDVVINELENRFRFPGQILDSESGLYYNWHRFYDPETGRYVSADPIGLAGGINLYSYVSGDPINFIDPWGLLEHYGFSLNGQSTSSLSGTTGHTQLFPEHHRTLIIPILPLFLEMVLCLQGHIT
jgi:RHS repeat-associated protein